jgi:hypothetical protein
VCSRVGVCVCACNLTYLACKERGPHRHVWPLWFHNTCSHYLIHSTIFGEKSYWHKIFRFSVQIISKTFVILRKIQRGIAINAKTFTRKEPVIVVSFIETWIFRQMFESLEEIEIITKFNQNPSSRGRTSIRKAHIRFRQGSNPLKI